MLGHFSSRIASRGAARARAVLHALERGTSPRGCTHPLALRGTVRNGDSARTAPSQSSFAGAATMLTGPWLSGGGAFGNATTGAVFSGAMSLTRAELDAAAG